MKSTRLQIIVFLLVLISLTLIGCDKDNPFGFLFPAKYTVFYQGNGNTGGAVPIDDSKYSKGDVVLVLENVGDLAKTDFIFAGWNTKADGSGTMYAAGDSFAMPDGDTTLYASWTAILTLQVTYNSNGADGGAVPVDADDYVEGEEVTVVGPGTLTRTGHTFGGWNTEADGSGDAYVAGNVFDMPDTTVTLYAQWTLIPESTYIVTYDGNGSDGGAVPTDANEYHADDTVTVSGEGTMIWTDHYFAGWNTDSDGSGDSYFAGEQFAMPAANITLYAQWTTDPVYHMIYVGNGSDSGEVPSDDTSYLEGDNVTVLGAGTMARIDFEFAGWNTETAGTGTERQPGDSFTMGAADITLFAQWRAWDKKVDSGGGNDYAAEVAVDPADGSVYVVGYGFDLVGATAYDWWIKKYTSSGQEITTNWDKRFDGNLGNDYAQGVAVGVDGSVYVVGYGQNLADAASSNDWWFIKYSASGVELWSKIIDSGNGPDHAFEVMTNVEGGGIEYVYVSGSGYNLISASSYNDLWIKKYNTDGTEIITGWDKQFHMHDPDYALELTAAGQYIYMAGQGGGSSWMKRFDRSTGAESSAWNKSFGYSSAYGIGVGLSDGSVYLAGFQNVASWDWCIRKFSSSADEDATDFPVYFDGSGGTDYIYDMVVSDDDELYVVGVGSNLLGTGDNDWWMKKLASDGSELWERKFDSNGDSYAHGVALTPDESAVYVVGYGSYLVPGGNADWWIKKFSSDGVEQ